MNKTYYGDENWIMNDTTITPRLDAQRAKEPPVLNHQVIQPGDPLHKLLQDALKGTPEITVEKPIVRQFASGATRDIDTGKHDLEGFLSPAVLQCYAEYMHRNRFQKDGKIRDSDNWQKGIPVTAYMKSLWRHVFDVWKNHRGLKTDEDLKTSLCAVTFNAMGYLHEVLKKEETEGKPL